MLILLITVSIYDKAQAQNLWANAYGDAWNDQALGMAADAGGNIYVTGNFESDSMVFGAHVLYNTGSACIYTVKFDSGGNVLWLKGTTGPGAYTVATGICIDAGGNAIITGYYFGSPSITFGSYTLPNPWFTEQAFIVKYDPSGNVIWATGAGDYDTDAPSAVACDGAGNIYITGFFSGDSSVFDNITIYNAVIGSGYSNQFIAKYNSTGNVIWAEALNGSSFGNAVTVDANDNMYVTGSFYGATASIGGIALNGASDNNTFLAKYDPSGTVLWATATMESGNDEGGALATDGNGNVYVSGYFEGDTVIFGGYTLINTVDSLSDMYLAKYDPNGNVLWANSFGGSAKDGSSGLSTDAQGNVYVGCYFESVSIQAGSHVLNNAVAIGTRDVFVMKCDSLGTIRWIKQIGDIGAEYVCMDKKGSDDLVIAGTFNSPALPLGNFTLNNAGQSDVFVAHAGSCSANFTVYADTVPHNWIALNLSDGLAPMSYTWNWGDGTTSSGITPAHIYNTPGSYNICLAISDGAFCHSLYCDSSTYLFKGQSNAIVNITVISSTTTGIENSSDLQQIIFYPNPASDFANITTTGFTRPITLMLYDMTGKVVFREVRQAAEKLVLDISPFQNGVYFLEVESGGKRVGRRVVVGE